MNRNFGRAIGIAAGIALTIFSHRPAAADQSGNAMLENVQRIIFLGDSLTDGAAWPDWVVQTLQTHGHPQLVFANAGICGDTIALVKARTAQDVLALHPDLVVLCIGVNDVSRGVPREQYLADMDEVISRIRSTGAKVLLLTPPALESGKLDAELIARRPLLVELAARRGCTVGDLHAAFEKAAAAGKRLWGQDGVHHNLDGWRTMGRVVLAALGCQAEMLEQVSLHPGAVTNWFVGPPVAWKPGQPIPNPAAVVVAEPLKAGWIPFEPGAVRAKAVWYDLCMLDRGGIMPLGSPPSTNNAGVFSAATVTASAERTALLEVGGSPPLAVWVNGEPVWSQLAAHGYHPNADRVRVRLRKGENQIVTFSTWLFHVSLATPPQ